MKGDPVTSSTRHNIDCNRLNATYFIWQTPHMDQLADDCAMVAITSDVIVNLPCIPELLLAYCLALVAVI